MRITRIPSQPVLFLHIETVPLVPHFQELSEGMRRIFEKKTAHIRGEKHSVEDFFVQQAAIWAEFSKVVCISCAYIQQKHILRIKNFYGDDELALLTEFIALLNKCWNSSDGFLCAHNAKKFHFPFLCKRILINNLHIPYALDVQGKKPWEIKHLDTMELWQFGDQRHFTSLELLAEVFNITNKTNRKENKVYHMYYEGEKKWNDIVQGLSRKHSNSCSSISKVQI